MISEASRPSPWVALVALLAAPVVSAMTSHLLAAVLSGFRPSWEGVAESVLPFALVYLPVGGAMLLAFWRRTPFSKGASLAVGAACGVAVACMAMLLLTHSQYAWTGRYYLDVALQFGSGAICGLVGGLVFHQICRLGTRVRDD